MEAHTEQTKKEENPKSIDTSVKLTYAVEVPQISYSEEKEMFVMGTIHAPQYEPDDRHSRAPIDLVAVIDVSGSMKGQKLALVCETLNFVLQQLKSEDCLSLVTFDSNVSVKLPLSKMDELAKAQASEIISTFKAGSCTNLSGGLFAGLEQLVNKKSKNEIASVMLFTDGLANEGVKSTPALVTATEKILATIEGACTVFTFGYGNDHDSGMLKSIAECGRGLYYYIENAEAIPESFADCIGGLLSVVAQNLTLTIEPLNKAKIKGLETKYSHTQNDGVYDVKLGDLYSEENRNIICNVLIPKLEQQTESLDVVRFTLSCFNVITSSFIKITCDASVKRPEKTPADQEKNLVIDRQRNRIKAANSITTATELADAGRLDAAKKVILDSIDYINKSPSANDTLSKELVKDLEEASSGLRSRAEYDKKTKKMMQWKQQAHATERSVSSGYYESSAKKAMKSKYLASKSVPVSAPAPSLPQSRAYSTNKVTLNKKIRIGNEHKLLPDDEATLSSDVDDLFVWKMYVRGDDLDSVIEKVEFQLHKTFNPSHLTVTDAPFEIEKNGWGIFVALITIHFKPELNKEPCMFDHLLCFTQDDSSNQYEI